MRARRVDRARNTPPTPQGPFDDAAKNESPAKSQQGGMTGGVTRGGQATGSCLSESVPLVFQARNCDQRTPAQNLGLCEVLCAEREHLQRGQKRRLEGALTGFSWRERLMKLHWRPSVAPCRLPVQSIILMAPIGLEEVRGAGKFYP